MSGFKKLSALKAFLVSASACLGVPVLAQQLSEDAALNTTVIAKTQRLSSPDGKDVPVERAAAKSDRSFRPVSMGFNLAQDSHFLPGTSDRKGDYKGADLHVLLRNGIYLGTGFKLQTPQMGKDGKLHDTAAVIGTIGYDAKDWAVYGNVGLMNGKIANDIVYGIMNDVWERRPNYRKSPVNEQTILVGVQARQEYQWGEVPVLASGFSLAFNSTLYGELSTMRSAAGVASFVTLQKSDLGAIRQNIPGLPKIDTYHTNLYAGVAFEGIAHDLATSYAGTKHFQAKAIAGARWAIDDNNSFFFQATATSPEVAHTQKRPVGLFEAGYTLKFGN